MSEFRLSDSVREPVVVSSGLNIREISHPPVRGFKNKIIESLRVLLRITKDWLRDFWFYKFLVPIGRMSISIVRNLFFSLNDLTAKLGKSERLISASNIISSDQQVLAASTLMKPRSPEVLASKLDLEFNERDYGYEFPSVILKTMNGVTVQGCTNFISTDQGSICHDLYDLRSDYTAEEAHRLFKVDPTGSIMSWLVWDQNPEFLSEAGAFVDACAPNYAHWMTEVLPRIALFCSFERSGKVPLIVNSGLHKNIMNSLAAVVGPNRQVYTLPRGRSVFVEKLFYVSPTAYVPYEPRTDSLPANNQGRFNQEAMYELKRQILKTLTSDCEEKPSKKLFIKRKSGYRNLQNSAEIEFFLRSKGFTVLEPEELSFKEQVLAFRGASQIIGPIGASFANSIFCHPDTKIWILAAQNSKILYGYWHNVIRSSGGIGATYLLGQSSGKWVHSDFVLELSTLERAFDSIT